MNADSADKPQSSLAQTGLGWIWTVEYIAAFAENDG